MLSTLGRFHFVQGADALAEIGFDTSLFTADFMAAPTRAHLVRPSGMVRLGEVVGHRWRPEWLERRVVARFDQEASTWLRHHNTPRGVFHGGSLYCRESLRVSRGLGIPCAVERSGAHIACERRLVAEERERLGIPPSPGKRAFYDSNEAAERMLEEYALADRVFVSSSFVRRTFIEEGVPSEKIDVAPLGANYPTPPWTPRSLEPFRVLSVGNSIEYKGMFDLLRAWKIAALPRSELRLRAPVLPSWSSLLRSDAITLLPSMPHASLRRYFLTSSVFCLLSIVDGFGMVVGEAMAHGCPVVVTHNVGACDMVDDGIDGFVVDIRSPEAVAERLVYLRDNPDALQEMSRNAMNKARQFSWSRYAEAVRSAWRRPELVAAS